jgi:uncharacterized Zn finger protein (UPF0148 family)
MKECDKCKRMKTASLADGRTVCTWCRAWLVECEARHLLAMPLAKRREALAARETKRGNIDELKKAMTAIHSVRQTESSTRPSTVTR